MAYGFDENVDYQKLINQDLQNQDYRSAAIHEAQRNEKIDATGASQYAKTSNYTAYLPKTESEGAYGFEQGVDYQKLINQDLQNQDYRSAAIHEAQRNEKIDASGGNQYAKTANYTAYLPQTEKINAGLDTLDTAKFDYDLQNDPVYQAYRKQYLREADLQTGDTMGAYAGMTGGVPSSAAVSAAQQAGNYQRSKLTDIIPTLYQDAFNRYIENLEQQRANTQLRYNVDEQRLADSLELQQQAADRNYQQWYMQSQERADADAYVNAMLKAGIMPADDMLARSGWSKADAQRYLTAALAGGTGSGSGGSGGSGSYRGSGGYSSYGGSGSYGSSGGSGSNVAGAGSGSGYGELVNQASHVSASNRDTMLQNIQNAYHNGQITEAEKQALWSAIGWSDNGWVW